MKTCTACGEEKPQDSFYRRAGGRAYMAKCRECSNAIAKAWRHANRDRHVELSRQSKGRSRAQDPDYFLRERVWATRARAKRLGLPFDLSVETLPPIPPTCPALGIPLFRGGGTNSPNTPELDRLRPELGYTTDNVRWLSRRANVIKQDATPEELHAVSTWLREQLPSSRSL